jgi:hypothetical protein
MQIHQKLLEEVTINRLLKGSGKKKIDSIKKPP